MTDIVPTTIEQLEKAYLSEIKKFLNGRNYENKIRIDEHDFAQEVLIKFFKENLLERYDPSRAQFKTFLNRIMQSVYLSAIRKRAHLEYFEEAMDEPDYARKANPGPVDPAHDTIITDEKDAALIAKLMQAVPRIEERLLLKLKLFLPGFEFSPEETTYLAERMAIQGDDVTSVILDLYNKKAGEKPGLRNEDIVTMLPFKAGSISTLYKRLVRKHITDQYILLQESEE